MDDKRGTREARAEQDGEAGAPQRTEDSVHRIAAAALDEEPEQGRQRIDRHRRGEAGGSRSGAAQRREQKADGGGGQCGVEQARGRHGGDRQCEEWTATEPVVLEARLRVAVPPLSAPHRVAVLKAP